MRFKVQNSAKTCIFDAFLRTKMRVWGEKVLAVLSKGALSQRYGTNAARIYAARERFGAP
jgi:hypothetical protein